MYDDNMRDWPPKRYWPPAMEMIPHAARRTAPVPSLEYVVAVVAGNDPDTLEWINTLGEEASN